MKTIFKIVDGGVEAIASSSIIHDDISGCDVCRYYLTREDAIGIKDGLESMGIFFKKSMYANVDFADMDYDGDERFRVLDFDSLGTEFGIDGETISIYSHWKLSASGYLKHTDIIAWSDSVEIMPVIDYLIGGKTVTVDICINSTTTATVNAVTGEILKTRTSKNDANVDIPVDVVDGVEYIDEEHMYRVYSQYREKNIKQ
jgi:hypothetical protein